MFKYKATFAYEGTRYAGWQIQPNGLGIQEVIQNKLKIFLKEKIDLTAAGRTDAGVHARAQTAHFSVVEKLDLFRFKHSLNALLPHDIRLIELVEVPLDFHARYSAKGKIYSYHLRLAPLQDPFNRQYTWHIPQASFSLDLMREASLLFLGEHDFKGFASESHRGVASRDSVRTMKRLTITSGEVTILEFEADGFLYKMVRNIVGTLVDIGRGQLLINNIVQTFERKDRRIAGQAAPAHALFLEKVLY